MTTYYKLEISVRQKEKKEPKKTVFKKFLDGDLLIDEAVGQPEAYDYVMFLYSDVDYGDVFLAWDNGYEDSRTLFFGKKGDEF